MKIFKIILILILLFSINFSVCGTGEVDDPNPETLLEWFKNLSLDEKVEIYNWWKNKNVDWKENCIKMDFPKSKTEDQMPMDYE